MHVRSTGEFANGALLTKSKALYVESRYSQITQV